MKVVILIMFVLFLISVFYTIGFYLLGTKFLFILLFLSLVLFSWIGWIRQKSKHVQPDDDGGIYL